MSYRLIQFLVVLSLAIALPKLALSNEEFDDSEWAEVEAEDMDSWEEIGNEEEETSLYDFYYHIAPYYSSFGLVFQLNNSPLDYQGIKSEYDVYRDLLTEAYLPEFMTLELSFYPMPLMGVGIRKHLPDTYQDAEITPELNLIESITAGFDEPYSLSLLFNSLTAYQTEQHSNTDEDVIDIGFLGYLISGGNYHIQRNKLIEDIWFELEWKLKGKFALGSEEYSWNFRFGLKNHDNSGITDTLFIAMKRDHVDIEGDLLSFLNNTGIEFTYVVDQSYLNPVETSLMINKYIPALSSKDAKISLDAGVIYENTRKYTGELKLPARENNLLFVIRPGIQF